MCIRYSNALLDLKNVIPSDYEKKKELEETINYACQDIRYKAPEIISMCFRKYCMMIIPHLPTTEEKWVNGPWNKILETAKENNGVINNELFKD